MPAHKTSRQSALKKTEQQDLEIITEFAMSVVISDRCATWKQPSGEFMESNHKFRLLRLVGV